MRFSKRSAMFRKDVMEFLQKPGLKPDANRNEDIVEVFHDIRFVNPRKLWVSERRKYSALWLEILGAAGCVPLVESFNQ